MKRLIEWGGFCAVMLLAGVSATGAVPKQTATKAILEKDAVCTACHNETWATPVLSIYQSRHGLRADSRAPGCQQCHGASEGHLKDFGTPPDVVYGNKLKHLSLADARNAPCLTCHDTRIQPRAHWRGSQHESRGVACTDCHNMHAAEQRVLNKATQAEVCFTCHKAQRAQVRRISAHPLAVTGIGSPAKMVCTDCHNPHGSTGPTLLVKNSVNETCYTCHAEKRGPFLWEHSPVSDNCVNCHTPHGSANPSLLKTRVPFLCQECHSGDHGNQVNSGANLATGKVTTVNGLQAPGAAATRAQLAARACVNCHVLVHGSNHPAGSKYQR